MKPMLLKLTNPARIYFAVLVVVTCCVSTAKATAPNVIIVMTDDQGYGELSCHGNPVLKTPHLDRLYAESIRFVDFHVAPMCTPTRGQLLTGLDALRNGAMNVSSGRTLLRREVVTLPQLLAAIGYRTGLFGKWHLGDTYPYRPEDRGFHETLWFPSSHISSVPDFWENDYFDDTYRRNGRLKKYAGYTTDIFFGEAIDWMKSQAEAKKPFFCYLPTAAPHGPLFVPEKYRKAVRQAYESVKDRLPKMSAQRAQGLVSYLGMIANIDDNIGRLENFLRKSGQRDNTILIFLTDNGSTFGPEYFNAGMRGGKTTLWEGGHRVPCFVRWPAGKLRQPGDIAGLTQVQDLVPTLLDLCDVPTPKAVRFDGISLGPVLRGKTNPPEERMLVINYSRMPFGINQPTANNPAVPKRNGAAVMWKRWRLLQEKELYDLSTDPGQKHNVIEKYPQVAKKMQAHLNKWWEGVKEKCMEFQPSVIGSDQENPVRLTACEWADVFVDQQRQVRQGVSRNGFWHIEVAKAGTYKIQLRRFPSESSLSLNDAVHKTKVTDGTLVAGPAFMVAQARIKVGGRTLSQPVKGGSPPVFEITLPAGRTTLQTWFLREDQSEIAGAYYVTIMRK